MPRCSCWRRPGRSAAGGHVRVDVFYAHASARTRALIDLAGSLLLLLPFALALLWLSAPYAARSWAILERSQEASGLPLVFLLKTLIPVFALMMALQGVAQAIRAVTALGTALMPLAETLSRAHGRGRHRRADGRLSGGADARRRVARLRRARRRARRHETSASSARCRERIYRRDDQRGAARHSDVHLHGRDAGALARRGGTARDAWAACSARCAAASAFRW